MQYEQLIASMTPELYERLQDAVQTGRWSDGSKLSEDQLNDSMALVMMYQARHLNQHEPFTIDKTGTYIEKSKAELKREQAAEIARFNLTSGKTES